MIATPSRHFTTPTRKRSALMSRDTEIALLHQVQQGDREAARQLIDANYGFVVTVARNYQNQGLPLEDLIQEGAMGLQRAIRKFDPSSPNKLISYAVWWIRQAILSALADQSRVYKTPARYHDLGAKAERARRRVEQEHRRPAGMDEVAKALRMPEDELRLSLQTLRDADSLDSPIGEDTTRLDLLAGPGETEARHEADEQRQNIAALLKFLEPIDQEILRRFFGFRTGEPETLREIAEHLEISHERVRQRRDKALEKLKRPASKMNLFTPTHKGAKS